MVDGWKRKYNVDMFTAPQNRVDAFRAALNVGEKSFRALVRRKRRERGGFGKRIFLEYSEEP